MVNCNQTKCSVCERESWATCDDGERASQMRIYYSEQYQVFLLIKNALWCWQSPYGFSHFTTVIQSPVTPFALPCTMSTTWPVAIGNYFKKNCRRQEFQFSYNGVKYACIHWRPLLLLLLQSSQTANAILHIHIKISFIHLQCAPNTQNAMSCACVCAS